MTDDTTRNEAALKADRWFWQENYLHPVERGFSGFVEEWALRLRDIAIWTISLALTPPVLALGLSVALAIGLVFLALLQAGLIGPTDDSGQEQPAQSMVVVIVPIDHSDASPGSVERPGIHRK
ncbi:hypothetical protein [Nocardioides seonyuensis]|uniref:hypothetical protein n=1 Tax=Nocardioides seonyuensis TaxID=2518371 RepID=UPI001FC91F4A|nr:hypothetical protein [Nocardioides seonyuensis]